MIKLRRRQHLPQGKALAAWNPPLNGQPSLSPQVEYHINQICIKSLLNLILLGTLLLLNFNVEAFLSHKITSGHWSLVTGDSSCSFPRAFGVPLRSVAKFKFDKPFEAVLYFSLSGVILGKDKV